MLYRIAIYALMSVGVVVGMRLGSRNNAVVQCKVIAVDQRFHRLDSIVVDHINTAAAVEDMLKVKGATFLLIKCDTLKIPN